MTDKPIPHGVIQVATRLMSCSVPCGFTAEDVKREVERLAKMRCPWPVPPDSYLPFGSTDPRLFVREGAGVLDVVFSDPGIKVYCGKDWADAEIAARRFIEQSDPWPHRWAEYAALVREGLAAAMAKKGEATSGPLFV